jgi:hypothetical protein
MRDDAMTDPVPKPTLEDITAFARRHGLDRLPPEHLARMTELALNVSELGRGLPRPAMKEDPPAPTFEFSRPDDR